MEHNPLCQLEEALAESDLPFRVDVLDWCTLSEDFRKEIEARFEVIQEPDRLVAQTNLPSASHEP